jgi:hypothetical protein
MKTNAEYKQDERDRKKKAGKKRIEFWIDPINELKIKSYVYHLEVDTKITKNSR